MAAVARLGIAENTLFHDLRHAFASLMFAVDFSPFETSRYLGHASLELLGQVYGHPYPTDYDAQIAKAERVATSNLGGRIGDLHAGLREDPAASREARPSAHL